MIIFQIFQDTSNILLQELSVEKTDTFRQLYEKIAETIPRSKYDGHIHELVLRMNSVFPSLEISSTTTVEELFQKYGEIIHISGGKFSNGKRLASAYKYSMKIPDFSTLLQGKDPLNGLFFTHDMCVNCLTRLIPEKMNEPYTLIIVNRNGMRFMVNRFCYLPYILEHKKCPITEVNISNKKLYALGVLQMDDYHEIFL